MANQSPMLRFPVLAAGAEHLVMGYLMKRNILTYKAPPMNEGYDLICIHPDPKIIRQLQSRLFQLPNRIALGFLQR